MANDQLWEEAERPMEQGFRSWGRVVRFSSSLADTAQLVEARSGSGACSPCLAGSERQFDLRGSSRTAAHFREAGVDTCKASFPRSCRKAEENACAR